MRAVALLVALIPALASAIPAKKILVVPSKAEQGLTQGSAALLDEIMSSELSKDVRFDVVTWADVSKLLEVQTARQKLGCDTDSCMAEIGGALGAEFIVTATLGQLGRSFVVSVRMVRVSNATVSRWTETVPASEDVLAEAVRHCVHEVLPQEPSIHRASYIALGVAGGVAAASTVLAGLTYEAVAERNSSYDQASQFNQDQSRAQALRTGANVGWGLTAATAATSVVLWIIEWKSHR